MCALLSSHQFTALIMAKLYAAPMQPAFVADAPSPDQQQKKKHGGSRQIVLAPPIYLLFDEPSDSGIERGAAVIAGRTAVTRSVKRLTSHVVPSRQISSHAACY